MSATEERTSGPAQNRYRHQIRRSYLRRPTRAWCSSGRTTRCMERRPASSTMTLPRVRRPRSGTGRRRPGLLPGSGAARRWHAVCDGPREQLRISGLRWPHLPGRSPLLEVGRQPGLYGKIRCVTLFVFQLVSLLWQHLGVLKFAPTSPASFRTAWSPLPGDRLRHSSASAWLGDPP